MIDHRPGVVLQLHAARPSAEAAALEACDDDALMALAAADHRSAFEVLAGRHLAVLAAFCAKFLGSPRAGEEVAQDVLVEAWTRRRGYRPAGRFRVLLLAMARTRCLNRLRDDRRRHARAPALAEAPVESEAAAARADQLEDLLERERERQVRAALLELPTSLREAVLLRFDHGLDYAEIARVVGRPEGTVRSRVFHALKRLRGALAAGEEP
jgi:RNA polymerase sigma-70 factor (ECF subfamily)